MRGRQYNILEHNNMIDPTNSRYRHITLKSNLVYRRFVQEGKRMDGPGVVMNDHEVPAHGSYGALLFTPQWKAKRQEILNRDNQSCKICHSNNGLQVHHRQYHFVVARNQFRLPWEYPGELLISLCESCHKRGHSKYKVPTINI